MGLAREDYAVIVSPEYKENELGRKEGEDKTLARVLFTTQKRLEMRSRGGKKFRDMRDFHYDGRPRDIRIWDEAILPAKPLTLERYELVALLGSFRRAGHHVAAEELDIFYQGLKGQQDNALVTVPDLARLGVDDEEAREWEGVNKDNMEALLAMAGQTVRVRNQFPSGKTIVHYEEFLPDELTPMLILDASGGAAHKLPILERTSRWSEIPI